MASGIDSDFAMRLLAVSDEAGASQTSAFPSRSLGTRFFEKGNAIAFGSPANFLPRVQRLADHAIHRAHNAAQVVGELRALFGVFAPCTLHGHPGPFAGLGNMEFLKTNDLHHNRNRIPGDDGMVWEGAGASPIFIVCPPFIFSPINTPSLVG